MFIKLLTKTIDERKNPVAVVCGHGKPSTARIKDGLLPHIKQGSHIVHDKEKVHNGLVRAAKCTDEAHKADVRDPAYLEYMAMANNLCSWLKRYLRRFVGMDPKHRRTFNRISIGSCTCSGSTNRRSGGPKWKGWFAIC